MAAKGGGSGSTPASSGPVTAKEIYLLLLDAGASTTEAIGIMANGINESSLNPEAVQQGVSDPGRGLWQWENSSYPGSASLITGNPQADARAQVNYLAQTGGIRAARGGTPAESAANFAVNYEKCAECYKGGAQYNSRIANAATVAKWISSNHWPTGGGAVNPGVGKGLSGSAGGSSCLLSAPLVGCILTTSKARALIGGAMVAAALPIGLVGAVVLVAVGFRRSGAGAAVGKTAQAVGGAVGVIPGAQGVGAGIAAAGSAEARRTQARQRGRQAATQRREGERAASRQRAQDRHDEAEYKRARARAGRASATSSSGPPDIPPF